MFYWKIILHLKQVIYNVSFIAQYVLMDVFIDESPIRQSLPSKGENLSCSYCHSQFSSLQLQREHYKLDWHRYNIKQSLLNKSPISEQSFTEKSNNGR